MKRSLLFISMSLMVAMAFMQSCYKDKGNYTYKMMPDSIGIAIPVTSFIKTLNKDTLFIKPEVLYAGDANDLSYEWQKFVSYDTGYVTFQTGKDLAYKLVEGEVIPTTGEYSLRLAVINKKLLTTKEEPAANQTYSVTIDLTVVSALNRGLLVFHGNDAQSDIGLIAHNIFMPNATTTVTTAVTPDFYSAHNNGEKIEGKGWNLRITEGMTLYAFTDKTNVRADYVELRKSPLDYTSMLTDPSYASGKPQYFNRFGTSGASVLIDNGKLFYGDMLGPLFNPDFDYSVAPQSAVIFTTAGSSTSSVGAVAFDNLSHGFIHSLYNGSATYVYKMPASTVGGVNFDPQNTNSDILYMDLRTPRRNLLAVMKERTTNEQYLVNMNFYVPDLSKVTQGRYSMNSFPDISQAKFYAFSGGDNLNYYATGSKVYQYTFGGTFQFNTIFTAPAGEEITLMKFIKYEAPNSSGNSVSLYQYSNTMMVVGTADAQGNGRIYTFLANLVTGLATPNAVFDGTESGGSRFGKIYDVDIKTQ